MSSRPSIISESARTPPLCAPQAATPATGRPPPPPAPPAAPHGPARAPPPRTRDSNFLLFPTVPLRLLDSSPSQDDVRRGRATHSYTGDITILRSLGTIISRGAEPSPISATWASPVVSSPAGGWTRNARVQKPHCWVAISSVLAGWSGHRDFGRPHHQPVRRRPGPATRRAEAQRRFPSSST
jgi:hypothetical protein